MSTDADRKPIFQPTPNEIFSVERQAHFQRALEQFPRELVFESGPEIQEPVFKSLFAGARDPARDAAPSSHNAKT